MLAMGHLIFVSGHNIKNRAWNSMLCSESTLQRIAYPRNGAQLLDRDDHGHTEFSSLFSFAVVVRQLRR